MKLAKHSVTQSFNQELNFVQIIQTKHQCLMAEWSSGGPYQQVHHVGFVVPQRLDRMKNVHRVLVLKHLAHNADGAERPAAPASVPATTRSRKSLF